MRGPWSVQGDDDECAVIHYILRNNCYVTIDGREPILLRPGDLAVFPYGTAHAIGDGTSRPVRPLSEVLGERRLGSSKTVRLGEKGERSELLCASLHFDHGGELPLYRSLPSVIVLSQDMLAREPLLMRTLECLGPETERRDPAPSWSPCGRSRWSSSLPCGWRCNTSPRTLGRCGLWVIPGSAGPFPPYTPSTSDRGPWIRWPGMLGCPDPTSPRPSVSSSGRGRRST